MSRELWLDTVRILFGVIFLIMMPIAAYAQAPYPFKADATVDVPKGVFSRGPSDELKARAREQAFETGWRDYVSFSSTGARANLYLQHAKSLRDRAVQLCNVRTSGDNFDERTGKYWVELRGTCDVRATDALLASLSGNSGGVQATAASLVEKPMFAFVFFARRAADARTFLDKESRERSVTVETSGAETTSENSRSSAGRAATTSSEGASVTQRQREERKGTIDRRDTAYKFRVEQSEGVDNSVTNVLTTAGYEVVKFSDMLSSCPVSSGFSLDEVVTTFANPAENQAELVPAALRGRMIAAARDNADKDCKASFFAVGLLDILKSEDLNGRVRVTVALTADVRDIRRRIPTAVAAIPAAQKTGLGRDRLEATNNALQLAATEGAREIVDMLRQRGLN